MLASTFGLAAAATEHLPIFPTYPDRMTESEVSAGMAMPYAAYAVMGKGGVIAVLLMGFMAVTSAVSWLYFVTPCLPSVECGDECGDVLQEKGTFRTPNGVKASKGHIYGVQNKPQAPT